MKYPVMLVAIETNIDVHPPIFAGTKYRAIDRVTKHYSYHPPIDEYVIEMEEYDMHSYGVVWRQYNMPAYLFKVEEPMVVKRCECGMENTWQYYHKRSCPKDKHSDWCMLYAKT